MRDLKKAGPSVHTSLSLLHELKVKENLCIDKVKEAELVLHVCTASITQQSIKRLQVELSSQQEASSALRTQIEGVIAERSSLRK